MADRPPRAEDASGVRNLEGVGNGPPYAGGLIEAVQQAASELTQPELDALSDPSFRSQASRWRSGSGSKKVSAALARMLNSLHAIRPQWLSSLRRGGEEPPAVVPLPLNGPAQPSTSWFLTRLSWMERMVKLLGSYVRTVVVLVVLLCFPKLVSAFIAFSIRLVLRLCSAIVIRLLREVWIEMVGFMGQITNLTSGVEQSLVVYLEDVMMSWSSGWFVFSHPTTLQTSPMAAPMAEGLPPQAAPSPCPPPTPPPRMISYDWHSPQKEVECVLQTAWKSDVYECYFFQQVYLAASPSGAGFVVFVCGVGAFAALIGKSWFQNCIRHGSGWISATMKFGACAFGFHVVAHDDPKTCQDNPS